MKVENKEEKSFFDVSSPIAICQINGCAINLNHSQISSQCSADHDECVYFAPGRMTM